MMLDCVQKRLLKTTSRLPLFGFWQGMLVAFPDYFKHKPNLSKHLICNTLPDGWNTSHIAYYSRFLQEIKPLVASNYLTLVKQGIADETIGVNSIFKITDRAWRAVEDNREQKRLHHYNVVTCTPHDLLVSAILLTFSISFDCSLLRPVSWRSTSKNVDCPLPDGVIVSPFGEITAIEVERHVHKDHLEGHILYHGKNSRVILIFERFTQSVREFTLSLLRKYEMQGWYFTKRDLFLETRGRGPYFNYKDEEFFFSENGQMVGKEADQSSKYRAEPLFESCLVAPVTFSHA